MNYPDDFNQAAFDARYGATPDHLADDYDYIENRADAVLEEMVQAVRAVAAKHSLSFFNEAEDVLRDVLYDEFLYSRVKVSEDAIIEAGLSPPETKHAAVARGQRLATSGLVPEEGSMKYLERTA